MLYALKEKAINEPPAKLEESWKIKLERGISDSHSSIESEKEENKEEDYSENMDANRSIRGATLAGKPLFKVPGNIAEPTYVTEQKDREGKTIIVSNRLPMKISLSEEDINVIPSTGGLATGMKSVHSGGAGLWIGWSGLAEDDLDAKTSELVDAELAKGSCSGVPLSNSDVENFYLGFSNKALWPLFHYFLEYTQYDSDQWQTYKRVNQKFADVVCKNLEDGDKVWVHDYQLLLLPKLIREKKPDVSIGFFLHIPFPSMEILRTFPWREEILEGMLGADLIGFHTHNYVRHFISSLKRILHLDVNFNEIAYHERIIKCESFPMGIDYYRFHNAALKNEHQDEREKSDVQKKLDEFIETAPDAKIILCIDRLDYTKGIPNRLRAFEIFLDKYPQYKEKVRLVMLAVPSRSNVPQYQQLKCEVDELVGRINGKFATVNWNPIWYYYRSMPFENLIDLYTSSHIALVTPVRDGMNLVAKEFVATRTKEDGVLILSEMAGAAKELTEAIQINPYNYDQIADALHQALSMPSSEQRSRIKKLQKRVSRYTVEVWAKEFMHGLDEIRQVNESIAARKLGSRLLKRLASEFKTAEKRMVLLDYDGTCVGFKSNPKDAFPDQELYDLLDRVSSVANTELCVISGRDRQTLEEWFAGKKYQLITDHGVWYRTKNGEWIQLEEPQRDWMHSILPVLERFSDKTPGTFVEVKTHSLAWHYRNADPELAEIRKMELDTVLSGIIAHNSTNAGTVNGNPDNTDNLAILRGNKVVEIKSSGVNKGRATTRLIADKNFDFILAAGDDWTDEYTFESLSEYEHAYTVKVGLKQTCAKYYVTSPATIRKILRSLIE